MAKNFYARIALTLTLIGLMVVVFFQSCQLDHLESIIVDSKTQTRELSDDVKRLTNLIESGGIQAQVGNNPSGTQHRLQRYFSATEWEQLNAPGNALGLRTHPWNVEETEVGGHFVRAMITDFPSLHPVVDNANNITEVYRYVNRAFAMRRRNDPDVFQSELAHRIEINEDRTQYHIWVREGVKWHPAAVDYDDPRYAWLNVDHYLTADDFVFYFETIRNPEVNAPHARNYYEDFDRIEVINDHELIIHWSKSYFNSIDATLTIEPLPRWLYGYDEDGTPYSEEEFAAAFNQHWYSDRMVGVGPYRFVRYEPNVALELERWEDYYDEKPPLQRITFRIIGDPNTRINNLLSGDIEYTDFLPLQYEQFLLNEDTGPFHDGTIDVQNYQGTVYRYLGWNGDGPLFSDRRVRRAMTHAFNREQVIRDIFHGLGRIQTGSLFMDGPYHNPNVEPWPFDLDRAAELLDQAGWTDSDGDGVRDKVVDGNRMDFEFTMTCYGYRQEFMAAMEIYKSDLERIGVRMTIDGVEWPIMVERMQNKDYDAYTGGWVLSWETDPYQIWHSSQADVPQGSNRVGFRNTRADEIIEEARTTFDLDDRRELFWEFHEILHEEQPYTFFFSAENQSAWRSNIQNVGFSPLRPFDYSASWYETAN